MVLSVITHQGYEKLNRLLGTTAMYPFPNIGDMSLIPRNRHFGPILLENLGRIATRKTGQTVDDDYQVKAHAHSSKFRP